MEFNHVSVLLDECIDNLNIKEDGVYVDCTMGGAGHSKEIVKRLSKDGLFIGFDQDKNAIATAKERLAEYSDRVRFVHSNFSNIKEELEKIGVYKIDGVLADLGVSSHQLDEADRGFSYMHDAPLDMRMDIRKPFSAYDVVNTYTEEQLAKIIKDYGEDKMIDDAVSMMNKGGRICIITFHSLEDRIVKNEFKELSLSCVCPPELPICRCDKVSEVKVITRKPILPSKEEVEANPRSRSAKLRVAEKK